MITWYIAVLRFSAGINSGRHVFVLIQAPNDESAYEQALFLGREKAEGWTFDGLHDLQQLNVLKPGPMSGDVSPNALEYHLEPVTTITSGTEVYFFRSPPSPEAWLANKKEDLTLFWDPRRDRRLFPDG